MALLFQAEDGRRLLKFCRADFFPRTASFSWRMLLTGARPNPYKCHIGQFCLHRESSHRHGMGWLIWIKSPTNVSLCRPKLEMCFISKEHLLVCSVELICLLRKSKKKKPNLQVHIQSLGKTPADTRGIFLHKPTKFWRKNALDGALLSNFYTRFQSRICHW